MKKKSKERSQKELYRMLKAAGEFITAHSKNRTQRFNEFYNTLRKEKASIKYVEQGNDFDLLVWWKGRWKSFNMMAVEVFQ